MTVILSDLESDHLSGIQKDELYQFIGELEWERGEPVLIPRVARCVTGLDLEMYREVVKMKRAYEESL